jgi:hypothetical protein
MSSPEARILAKVARILSPSELIITAGESDGVETGDAVEVLDPNATDVRDPDTNEPLGSLRRVVARGTVREVEDRISLVRRVGRSGIGSLGALIAGGANPEERRGEPWAEGVRVGDPVEAWRPREASTSTDELLAVGAIVEAGELGRCQVVDVHPDRKPTQYTVETVEGSRRRATVDASSVRAIE